MIITDNYILKVFNKDGETYIFSYETPDVWTALKEFWHEDYEHIACNDSWDIDAYAMENGEVIDTYKFHLCTSAFHHFFDNGHITLNEFMDLIMKRSVWLRLGVTVTGTAEDIEKLFDGDKEMLRTLIERKQYELDGNAYIPECSVESYNEEYGTDYAEGGGIDFEL